MNATPAPRDNRLRGIAIMCIAVCCFTWIDTIGKYLIQTLPVGQVVWGRFTFALIVGSLLSLPGIPGSPSERVLELVRTHRPWLQFFRSLLLIGSTAFNFLALRYLQLDQALAIMFSGPFMVAALSIPILGERVGPRRWAAIGVGFLGVLVVTRPGYGGIHPAAILSLLTAACYALYSITTRLLAHVDSSETTLFYSNLVGTIATAMLLPFVWQPAESWTLYGLMVVQGAGGALGHYLMIRAHRIAPASVLSPFIYTQIVWVILAGYLVFGDLPNSWTLTGSAIVIVSGLYLLYRERKVRGEAAPPSADPIA